MLAADEKDLSRNVKVDKVTCGAYPEVGDTL